MMKRNLQEGRTIVEVLSVLALMGLMTVIALRGIQYAFAKNESNVIYNDIKYLVMQLKGNTPPSLPNTLKSIVHSYSAEVTETGAVLGLENVPERVCDLLMKGRKMDFIAYIKSEGKNECSETNKMAFYTDFPNSCSVTSDCERDCYTCVNGQCKKSVQNASSECVECLENQDCPSGYWCRVSSKKCISNSNSNVKKLPYGLIYYDSTMKFEDAQNFCDSLGMSILSRSFFDIVSDDLRATGANRFWISNRYRCMLEASYKYCGTSNTTEKTICQLDVSQACPDGMYEHESRNMCVECIKDADCPEDTPYCSVHNICVSCLEDAHCPVGSYCSTNTDAACPAASDGCIQKSGLSKQIIQGKTWYVGGLLFYMVSSGGVL